MKKRISILGLTVVTTVACFMLSSCEDKDILIEHQTFDQALKTGPTIVYTGNPDNPYDKAGVDFLGGVLDLFDVISSKGLVGEDKILEWWKDNVTFSLPQLSDKEKNILDIFFSEKELNVLSIGELEQSLLSLSEENKSLLTYLSVMRKMIVLKDVLLNDGDITGKGNGGTTIYYAPPKDDPEEQKLLDRLRDTVSDFDDCFDEAVDRRLSEIFDKGNWVDKAKFIAGIPGSFVVLAAAATVDCI